MSVEYTYDEALNFIYTRFFGVVTDQDLRGQAEAVAKDPRVGPGARELVDLRDVDSVTASPQSLEHIIQSDLAQKEKFKGQRTAIVAPTDFLFGFARMYEILSELREAPSTVGVFRTAEEAREWLSIGAGKA